MPSSEKPKVIKSRSELCVLCGRQTNVNISTPIEQRIGYIEGVGQLCYSCQELLKKTSGLKFSPEQFF